MARDPHRALRDAWIVSAVRTPIGRYGGALRSVRPDDLAAIAVAAAVERAGVDPASIDDVVLGNANGAGEENRNVARMAALLAGLPVEVAGQTVNRLCGSGLQALNSAAHAIMVGDGDVFVAGGVESMTRAPWVMLKPETGHERGEHTLVDTTLGWRFVNPRLAERYGTDSMGQTGENVADRNDVTRIDQDAFALTSQQRAAAAMSDGRLREQLVPVPITQRDGSTVLVERDEHPRPDTTLEGLAALRPAFRQGGTVTAGNSSGINDGAAALVLVEAERARSRGLRPLARVVSTAVAGVEPSVMGLGPIPMTPGGTPATEAPRMRAIGVRP
jgi:acetyl-CoA acetyltransferase family protein